MNAPLATGSSWLSSRRIKYAFVLMIGFAAVLLFLLSTATAKKVVSPRV